MRTQKGFTLIELLFVIAIISIISITFVRPFSLFQKEQLLRKETDMTTGLLEEARIRTVASIHNMQYGVHFASSSVTLFQGTVFSSGAAGNEMHSFDSLIVMNTLRLQGGGSDVVFKKRTGETDFYGTTTLAVVGGTASSSISIYRSGLIEVR